MKKLENLTQIEKNDYIIILREDIIFTENYFDELVTRYNFNIGKVKNISDKGVTLNHVIISANENMTRSHKMISTYFFSDKINGFCNIGHYTKDEQMVGQVYFHKITPQDLKILYFSKQIACMTAFFEQNNHIKKEYDMITNF